MRMTGFLTKFDCCSRAALHAVGALFKFIDFRNGIIFYRTSTYLSSLFRCAVAFFNNSKLGSSINSKILPYVKFHVNKLHHFLKLFIIKYESAYITKHIFTYTHMQNVIRCTHPRRKTQNPFAFAQILILFSYY